jgi:hypothetical protein
VKLLGKLLCLGNSEDACRLDTCKSKEVLADQLVGRRNDRVTKTDVDVKPRKRFAANPGAP